MAQQQNHNPNGVYLTTDERIEGVLYEIRAFGTDDGLFAPEASVADYTGTGPRLRSVYLGGEDDENDETPEAAIEHGRRLLREQAERGNLDA